MTWSCISNTFAHSWDIGTRLAATLGVLGEIIGDGVGLSRVDLSFSDLGTSPGLVIDQRLAKRNAKPVASKRRDGAAIIHATNESGTLDSIVAAVLDKRREGVYRKPNRMRNQKQDSDDARRLRGSMLPTGADDTESISASTSCSCAARFRAAVAMLSSCCFLALALSSCMSLTSSVSCETWRSR